ncbi:MAG: S9 family peptidase, partial [Isosphaeraceae bacterium]|nr:S9 family peptidase [Isosphaeraceae bacterium]
AKTGAAKDLTPKLEVNTPPAPFGGSNEYAWSPDGQELAFTAEPLENPAWSTNTDIWVVPVEGGEPKNITAENKGADAQPSYFPAKDLRLLAYVSQARAGFESDLWVLKLTNTRAPRGQTFEISSHLDRPIQSFTWPRERFPGHLFAVIDDAGSEPIVELRFGLFIDGSVIFVRPNRTSRRVVRGGVNTSIRAPEASALVFVRADSSHPGEIYKAKADGSDPIPLTQHNTPLLSSLDLSQAEGFTFKGADNDDVSGWLIRPPGFVETKKYPVVFLIHGGPQGAWHDEWHARWNYQLFAAPGYAVIAINPRGSTGYGQKFTDQITKDWTGRVYEDLMKGLDYALKQYPFLDESRMAAAGGSYGGFMVNWIAGHSDRFQALVSHAGVFDLTSKYGTTEELWFPEWEFGGTPWDNPQIYREQSPSSFVRNFKTPTLVLHGALDFRVPDAQGIGMFTALQRRGVPSRLVLFPDEGHWILKPANRVVWWREVHEWLAKYLKPRGE